MKFCGECGARVDGLPGNTASTGGGDVHGGLYQAGRDVVVNPVPSEPAPASYETIPKWRSPFTTGLLSWGGLFVGLVGLFPFWKLIQPALSLFGLSESDGPRNSALLVWASSFVVLTLTMVILLELRRIAKLQLRKPLIFGWALNGAGRRITIEKVRAGPCPTCGGNMKYFNKPTEWIDHFKPDGRKRREVTERVPALQCRRNSKHWFEVDPAEEAEA